MAKLDILSKKTRGPLKQVPIYTQYIHIVSISSWQTQNRNTNVHGRLRGQM